MFLWQATKQELIFTVLHTHDKQYTILFVRRLIIHYSAADDTDYNILAVLEVGLQLT